MIIRIHHDRKICPEDHWLASRGMPSDDKQWLRGMDFLSHPHTNNGFVLLLTIKYLILYWKDMKRLPENPEFAEMRHGEVILTLQWRHRSMCGQRGDDVQLFLFCLSHGLVQVRDRIISHGQKQWKSRSGVWEKWNLALLVVSYVIYENPWVSFYMGLHCKKPFCRV